MRLILALFLLLISMPVLVAQVKDEEALTSAQEAFDHADYNTALKLYGQLKDDFDRQDKSSKSIACSIGISKSNLALGQFDNAINECKTAIDKLATVKTGTSMQNAELHKLLGEAYLNSGLNDQALEKLKLSESYISNKDDLLYADLMEEIGIAYWNSGNDQLANEYHNMALQKRAELLPEGHELIADSYTNLGLVSLEEDYFNTLIFLKKALSIYEAKFGPNHLKVANVYFNLGLTNLENKTFTQATNYFNKVAEIYGVIYEGNHPNKAIIQSTLARIDYELGYHDKAIEKFNSALSIYREIYGEKHPEIADTYGRLGEVYRDKQDFRNAISNYQKAIYANLRDQSFSSNKELPALEKYFNADYLLRFLQAKAIALEELHYNKTLKPKDINAAMDTYILCDSLISRIKQIRLSEEDKIKTSAISNEIYEDGIRISIDIAEKSLNKKYYHEMAYQFFERSKASTLHEAINDTQAKSFAGIPSEVLANEKAFIEEIVSLENKLVEQGNNPEEEERLSKLLFEKNNQYRTFISDLEKKYPDYYELKYKTSLASSTEIQSFLKERETIVSYFVSEEGANDEVKNLYVMSIGKKKLSFHRVNLDDDFFSQIKGLRNAIKFRATKSTKKIGRSLFKVLFPAEIYEKYDYFTIIPDGALGTIPFESLIDEEDQFVIESKNINYDFSANLYLDNLKKEKSTQSTMLAVAPVQFNTYGNVSLNALPGTIREVEQLKRVSKSNNYEVNLWTNSKATETEFKSASLQDYDIIHFATHGEVNESEPSLSRIYLYPDQKNGNDGFLYSSEIYNLKLNADLVTLSACETGLGKVAKGEGIIGLSRSLKYAGSKNLIVSLWKVADQSTSDLMIDFYEKQQASKSSYASALREAKLSLLYSDKYSDPYFWAPFILIGK